jgi:hypothetical protein
MNFWSVPKEWTGERAYVIGGGPSFDIETAPRLKGRIVACNVAFKLFPYADVCCWSDQRFLVEYADALGKWKGQYRIARGNLPFQPPFDVKILGRTGSDLPHNIRKLSRDPSRVGGFCTGAMGLNLAALFGAKEIVLLGFDMSFVNGKSHWHDWHRSPSYENHYADFFHKHFDAMAPDLEQQGIKVWDCALNGKLQCFEKIAIEGLLA